MEHRSRRGGRPPRNRARHLYAPDLEVAVAERLQELAEFAGLDRGKLCESIIYASHDYISPWVPWVDLDVLGVDISGARRAIADLQPREASAFDGPAQPVRFRIDKAVADSINRRCDELDITYKHYLRRLLSAGSGVDAAVLRSQQETLFPYPARKAAV